MAEKANPFSAMFYQEELIMKRILPLLIIILLLAGCQTQTDTPIVTTATPATTTTAATVPSEATRISENDAKEIALTHAGLNTGAVKGLSIELDLGEGTYEVEFVTKGIEYEYEIDAYTGKILQAEKDRD